MTNNNKLYVINGTSFVAENAEEAIKLWNDFNTGNSDEAKEIISLTLEKKNGAIWTKEKVKELKEQVEQFKYV